MACTDMETQTTTPSRESVAVFIKQQIRGKCSREKGNQHHYGVQELRELLDFIYGTEPQNKAQEISLGSFYS